MPPSDGESRRTFLRRAGIVAGATMWVTPAMQMVRMAPATAQASTSVVDPGTSSTTTDPTRMISHSLRGEFVEKADVGSDPFWERLEQGSISGSYKVPAGTLPAVSGTSFAIPTFDIQLAGPSGDVVIRYLSGRDSGGFFADFFGPGSGDGFVFNDGATQFQVGFPSGFDGSGTSVTGAVFSADPDALAGEINVLSVQASVDT